MSQFLLLGNARILTPLPKVNFFYHKGSMRRFRQYFSMTTQPCLRRTRRETEWLAASAKTTLSGQTSWKRASKNAASGMGSRQTCTSMPVRTSCKSTCTSGMMVFAVKCLLRRKAVPKIPLPFILSKIMLCTCAQVKIGLDNIQLLFQGPICFMV